MNEPMKAYACSSGGVIFAPDTIEREQPKKVSKSTSNDNKTA